MVIPPPQLVTVLFYDPPHTWMLAHSSVVMVSPDPYVRGFDVLLDLGVRGSWRKVLHDVDEGSTWTRGHVTENDAEGRALLAAHALRDG